MARRRFSDTLILADGKICCGACERPLAAADRSWKEQAALTVVPVASLPGAGLGTDSRIVLRRFACSGCGTLLETEVALPEDPFLEDRIVVAG
ncbi:hypothetical protein [Vineibacter terrae]|uniref:hypothetical protein n=1 Tax=Vineibacter terrae TaxID=2586908 RepID=UPI0015B4B213|nr:hypothetical protein [Vineibacter terrae]